MPHLYQNTRSKLSLLLTTALCAVVPLAAQVPVPGPVSWSGYLPISYFENIPGCPADAASLSGHVSSAKSIGNGDICETDLLTVGGENTTVHTKGVTVCGSPAEGWPDAIYQFMVGCQDEDCQSCSDVPQASAKIPYDYFTSKPYPRCMEVTLFNATTTDPATEFAGVPPPEFVPTSERERMGGSDADFMGYWGVFTANSCMGPKPEDSTTSSAFLTGKLASIVFGVLSVTLIYVL